MEGGDLEMSDSGEIKKEEIEARLQELKSEFGDWTYDIPLPHDIWTKGKLNVPHTRLKRIVQIAQDLCVKPLSECRVLDLGCLDGIFSIEFALQGAETVGIEIREANIKKAIFCKEVLRLHNLTFLQDDVRNISIDSLGKFDAIICSGILYHLPAEDIFRLVKAMYEMTTRLLIIDTHVALTPLLSVENNGRKYWGKLDREHPDDTSQEERAEKLWASWDNPTSFLFTRPSLINMLSRAGFSSIFECFIPAHINFGSPGVEHRDRCTFVAQKGESKTLITSPAANALREDWPEDSLSYGENEPAPATLNGRQVSLYKKILLKLKRTLPS